jgi:hypothetical protein
VANESGHVNGLAYELENVIEEGNGHGRRQPPLTGGRKATSSPEWSGVSHAANS